MSYEKNQFSNLITYVLKQMTVPNVYSTEALNLLLGTAAKESEFGHYLRQLGGGPALGAFQMEPATFLDLQSRFGVRFGIIHRTPDELEWDLKLAIQMCRIKYFSCHGPIPKDLEGQAKYWKQWYNTPSGKGTVEEYLENYKRYVA